MGYRYYIFTSRQPIERYESLLEYDKNREGYNTLDECKAYIEADFNNLCREALIIYDSLNKEII